MEIAQSVLPVILMLVIGMLCRKNGILNREGINALKSVVVNFTLPAVMLDAFATMDFSLNSIIVAGLMFAICTLAWVLGKVLSGVFKLKTGLVPFFTTSFEAGMLGYSLYTMLYGADTIGTFASIDLGHVFFVYTLYKILLGMDTGKLSSKQIVHDIIHTPTVIAMTVGIIIGATGLYRALEPSGISGLFTACTDLVSAPTSAIILITIGYDLVLSEVKWGPCLKVVGLRLLILVPLRFLMGYILDLLGMGAELNNALNIMFILPTAYVLPVFTDNAEQRTYVSSVISVATLVTVAGFIFLAALA